MVRKKKEKSTSVSYKTVSFPEVEIFILLITKWQTEMHEIVKNYEEKIKPWENKFIFDFKLLFILVAYFANLYKVFITEMKALHVMNTIT